MPVYLFTYHAYRSWRPDRQQGYVRHDQGILPPDPEMADQYDRNAKETPVLFDAAIQKACIEEILIARQFQTIECHCLATDNTHVHALVSWQTDRSWETARNAIRSSMTRKLNKVFEKRTWFVENASRKRVKDTSHLDYLATEYLPKHNGWKWLPDRGMFQ